MATNSNSIQAQLRQIQGNQGNSFQDFAQALAVLGAGLSAAGRTTVGRPPDETVGGALAGFAGSLKKTRDNAVKQRGLALQNLAATQQIQAGIKATKRQDRFDTNKTKRQQALKASGVDPAITTVLGAATTPEQYSKDFFNFLKISSAEQQAKLKRGNQLAIARTRSASQIKAATIAAESRLAAAKLRLKAPGATREAKIQDQMTTLNITRADAVKLVDGLKVATVDPTSGLTTVVDKSTGKGALVQTPLPASAKRTLPATMTIAEAVRGGDIAGVKGGVKAGIGRTFGQLFSGAVDKQAFAARTLVRTESRGLIRALSNNPRFPVGEQTAIKKELDIEPALIDSKEALLARLEGINDSLSARAQRAEEDAADFSLPLKKRQEARSAATEIRNFLDRLGIKAESNVIRLSPDGQPVKGG